MLFQMVEIRDMLVAVAHSQLCGLFTQCRILQEYPAKEYLTIFRRGKFCCLWPPSSIYENAEGGDEDQRGILLLFVHAIPKDNFFSQKFQLVSLNILETIFKLSKLGDKFVTKVHNLIGCNLTYI